MEVPRLVLGENACSEECPQQPRESARMTSGESSQLIAALWSDGEQIRDPQHSNGMNGLWNVAHRDHLQELAGGRESAPAAATPPSGCLRHGRPSPHVVHLMPRSAVQYRPSPSSLGDASPQPRLTYIVVARRPSWPCGNGGPLSRFYSIRATPAVGSYFAATIAVTSTS